MTVLGKCNTCRARKIKCDEVKPVCGRCRKVGRECSYTAERNDQTGLSVRSSSTAAHGLGRYHTLILERNKAKPRLLSSGTDVILAQRWANACMSELDFGGLWQTIPVRLGHDEILDAAVTYHLDCQDFFKTQSDTSALTLLRSGTKAMEAMRMAVAKPRRDTRNAVAISMVVLAVAEAYRDFSGFAWSCHIQGFLGLRQASWMTDEGRALMEVLIGGLWAAEVAEAVYADTDSLLDNGSISPPLSTLPDENQLRHACNFVKDKMILVPRLVRYTRQFAAQLYDAELVPQIQSLVTSLYDHDFMLQMEAFISSITTTHPALHMPFTNPLNRSFTIANGQVYWLLAKYYMYRTIICGTMLRLWMLGMVPTSAHDKSSIEREDVRVAEKLCMCVEYATSGGPGADFKILDIRSPITLAWGALNRHEQRLINAQADGQPLDIAAVERTRSMKVYCKQTFDMIREIWHGGDAWTADFEPWAETYTGGPPMPWLLLKRVASPKQASKSPAMIDELEHVDDES